MLDRPKPPSRAKITQQVGPKVKFSGSRYRKERGPSSVTGDRLQGKDEPECTRRKQKRKSDRAAMLLTPPSSRSTPKRPSLASHRPSFLPFPSPPSGARERPATLLSPPPNQEPKRQGKVKLPFLPRPNGKGWEVGWRENPVRASLVPYAGSELRSHPSPRLTRQLRSNRRHRTRSPRTATAPTPRPPPHPQLPAAVGSGAARGITSAGSQMPSTRGRLVPGEAETRRGRCLQASTGSAQCPLPSSTGQPTRTAVPGKISANPILALLFPACSADPNLISEGTSSLKRCWEWRRSGVRGSIASWDL